MTNDPELVGGVISRVLARLGSEAEIVSQHDAPELQLYALRECACGRIFDVAGEWRGALDSDCCRDCWRAARENT